MALGSIKTPDDFRPLAAADKVVLNLWQDITPQPATNGFAGHRRQSYVETRVKRIRAGISKMNGGMRRPCCWQGCPHRVRNRRLARLRLNQPSPQLHLIFCCYNNLIFLAK